MEHIYVVKREIKNYLMHLISNNWKDAHFSDKRVLILKEVSSIPFVTHNDIKKIESTLSTLKKPSDRTSAVFHLIEEIGALTMQSFQKANEIFWAVFMGALFFSIFSILSFYFLLRKYLLKKVESVSNALGDLDFSRVFKLKERASYAEVENLVKGFNFLVDHVNLYRDVLQANANSEDLYEFAEKMYKGLKKSFKKINRLSIAEIIENDEMVVSVTLSDSKRIVAGEGFNQKLDPNCLEKIKGKKIFVVNDIENYLKKYPESSLTFFYSEDMMSIVAFPLYIKDKHIGILFLNSFEKDAFEKSDVKKLKAVSDILSYIYKKMLTIQNLILSIVVGFTELVEGKDEETGEHLVRMASYSRAIAEEMAKDPIFFKTITPKFIEQVYKQSPLHDIGKVIVPDRILQKPGKLDDDEFKVMKTHTVAGYKILDHIDSQSRENFFSIGKNIARSHHERWDGKGYPDGLKGEEIPLCARIVAVADVFDALTSERPYKKAFDYDRSVSIIIKESGAHFDPKVVNAFIRAQQTIKKLYKEFHEF